MCGRYSIYTDAGELAKLFNLSNICAFDPNYNAAPSQSLPIIIKDRIGLAKWGFVPEWAGDDYDGPTPINARAETVAEKPMFRDSFYKRRCLVPANGYYEWLNTTQGGKVPYFVSNPDDSPLAFAGMWSKKGDDVTFCIIVRPAIEPLSVVHHRMPVVVPPEDFSAWWSKQPGEWERILRQDNPYTDLSPREVSTKVNKVANNAPELMKATRTN